MQSHPSVVMAYSNAKAMHNDSRAQEGFTSVT
jgi:hypothetical protein